MKSFLINVIQSKREALAEIITATLFVIAKKRNSLNVHTERTGSTEICTVKKIELHVFLLTRKFLPNTIILRSKPASYRMIYTL